MGASGGVASVVTAIIFVLVLLSRTSTILKTVFGAAIKFPLNRTGLSFVLSFRTIQSAVVPAHSKSNQSVFEI